MKTTVSRPPSQAVSYLKYTQSKSLAWLEKQELGKTITITEVEETIEPNTG
jgi:hypothetical protein